MLTIILSFYETWIHLRGTSITVCNGFRTSGRPPDQTQYIFGDDPFNAGEGLLINTAEGMADSLTWWSKISNRDQQDILNIEAQPLEDFEKQLRQFFDWAGGTLERIKQMRQSLDPNGVVEPIPSNTAAPAPAMFTAK